MHNNKHDVAGFAWRRADRVAAAAGEWRMDLAVALAVALLALFFGMVVSAQAEERGESAGAALARSNPAAYCMGNPTAANE